VKFVLQEEEKCILMKSATEYEKSAPDDCFAGRRKMYFYEKCRRVRESAPNGCFFGTKKNVIYENGCSCKKQKNVFFESATLIAVFTSLKLSADCA
jgi:hypothetical protein